MIYILLTLLVLFGDEKHKLAPDVIRGANHAHIHRRSLGYGSETSKKELSELKRLGFNWIAITPFGYQRTAISKEISGFENQSPQLRDASMKDEDILSEIANAKALKISVAMKPHIWAGDFWNGNEWHGTVRQLSQKEHSSWWSTYKNFILHYASVAEKGNAEALIIGTELVIQTVNEMEWRDLIKEVRKKFSGKLSYAAHWDSEVKNIQFWDALDFIGVNAYYPLITQPNPTIETLVQAWQPIKEQLSQFAIRYKKPIVFLEVGYRPVKETHITPWKYSGGVPDSNAQANAFHALFKAFSTESWWKGLFIWKTYTDVSREEYLANGTDFTFRNRPAEKIIEQWFK